MHIKEVRCYIDDGGGFHMGSESSFRTCINQINEALQPYGLFIDESLIKEMAEVAPFLDILFCLDKNGKLLTDLIARPTDARS